MLTKQEVQNEKEIISACLYRVEQSDPVFVELYAAQQALAWVLNKNIAKAPFEMIMGTQANSKDCSRECRLPQS